MTQGLEASPGKDWHFSRISAAAGGACVGCRPPWGHRYTAAQRWFVPACGRS